MTAISLIQSGLIAGGKDAKEGRQTVLITAVGPMNENTKGTWQNEMELTPERILLDQCEKRSRQRISILASTLQCFLSLDNSVPADCLEEVVHPKTEEILYHKMHFSARLPPKVIVQSVWQVQHEGHAQRGDSTGEPQIDF